MCTDAKVTIACVATMMHQHAAPCKPEGTHHNVETKVKPVMWRVRWRDTGVPAIPGPASRQDAGNTKDRREKSNTYTTVTLTKLSAPRLFVKYDVKDGDRDVQQGEVAPRAQMCARTNGMVRHKFE